MASAGARPITSGREKSCGKYLGCHTTEEEAARAVDDYVEHGTVPESRTESSRFKGVIWGKNNNKWQAKSKGKYLGCHTTEEEAARAVDDYVEHGTVPESKRAGTSQFKGVTWNESLNKWKAQFEPERKYLGYHATEEEAAGAMDDYAKHGTVPESKKRGAWGSSQITRSVGRPPKAVQDKAKGKPSTKKMQTQ